MLKRIVAILSLSTMGIAPAAAQAVGIRPLTQDTLEEAKRIETVNELTRLASLLVVVLRTRSQGRSFADADAVLALAKDPPFSVLIQSPFIRVAAESLEARRKFVEPTFESLEAINGRLVEIEVSPGPSMATADAVENVVIKRGAQVLRPIKANIQPTTVQNRLGMNRELSAGTFTFDYAAFDPTTTITLVVVGRAGNFELELRPEELSSLR